MKSRANLPRHWRKRRGGQSLVEASLVLTFVMLPLTMGLLQYGVYLNAANMLTQLAREGGRYAALHGTESTYETATEDYIQAAAAGTSILPADLTDSRITVTMIPSTALRVSGNPIRVTITYPMKKKVFIGKIIPLMSDNYIAESTFIIE